jgi:hypothetical protein
VRAGLELVLERLDLGVGRVVAERVEARLELVALELAVAVLVKVREDVAELAAAPA